jgi:hypothetical protein
MRFDEQGNAAPMIPDFDEYGYLPPGVYRASIDEIDERFGRQSQVRAVQMESVRWLVDTATQAGVTRVVLNGSFVTETLEPNDVDCLLLIEAGYPEDPVAARELHVGFPFLDVQLVDQDAFERLVEHFFATDRHFIPKGMIEVML